MEGPFFWDYALNTFVGTVEAAQLDLVVIFMKKQMSNLTANSLRDGPLLEELVTLRRKVAEKLKTVLRSYELKDLLKGEVLDCLHCLKTSPKCIKKKYCFEDEYLQNQARLSIIVSVCLAVLAFGVISASAITYRNNRKLLLQ